MLTTRWFLLALALPALLILSAAAPAFAAAAFVFGALLLTLTVVDRAAAGTPEQFRLKRTHDDKLSLGVPNPVAVEVESRAPRSVMLWLRDDVPLDFHSDDHRAPLLAAAGPRESVVMTYHVRPLHRGRFSFGDLHLRWSGPLGLFTRQATYPAAKPVQVYPNLRDIRKYELLVRRDQLAEMGLRTVRLRGEGTAFESLRDYTPDDPYRSINWKATARRARPISTDYEPERSQRIVIALDVSRMMRSPIRVADPSGATWEMAKVDTVINSVLLLSYVAARKGDQVGLMVFADRVLHTVAPAPGEAHFRALLETLYALESQPVEADYARALQTLRAQQKKRALLVLFTDLSGERASEALLTHLPPVAKRHLPLLVTIRDPALDEEAGQRPGDSSALYRRAVAEQLLDERRLLLENLSRRGVLTLDVDAEHLSMTVVNRYLQLKTRGWG